MQDSAPLVRSNAVDASQITEAQASARAKRRADAIKHSLQPVPAKRSSLLLPALRVLAGLRFDRAAPLEDTQADVLLGVMLLTGCHPEEVRDVRIWKTESSAKSPDKFAIILDSKKFRIPVRPITEGWKPGVDEAHLYRKTQDHFFVSIPTKLPVARLVLDYGLARHKGEIESSWPTDPDDIKQLLKARLKTLNDQFHLSLTPVRVSGYLSSAVYALDGDAADALLLTGSRADKNDSRSFYYSPSTAHLEAVYDAIWERLYSSLHLSALPRRRRVSSTHQCNCMCAGSQGVPKSEVLREILFKLDSAIRNAPIGRGSRVAAKKYHNLVTAALSTQVLWMTGIRPARDVIEYRNYDASTGFLAVRDKDNEDESTVRLVYLIPELQAQIEAYDQHLRRLAERFEVDPDDLAFRVIVKARSGSEFRIRELEAHTGVKYPIRPNSHRHFLRTRLREKGVDGAYVDGLLGHGGIAGEVHGSFSAIAPGDIQRATSTPISELYREIELRPVFK
ncbi:MAG: site-specific integrase [Wenzhouxiangella sp.]|nr:site-specific integrase [Wenzhouxiangella sp.]